MFAFTKARLFLIVSLIFTWWLARLLPRYHSTIRSEISSRLQEARQKIPSIQVDWVVPDEPSKAYNASKVALIIEPRPLPHLVPLMLHMMAVVPPDWRFVFIGSHASIFSVGRAHAISNQQIVGKLDMLVLPEPWNITSKEMIFRMLTDLRFYEEFLPGVEWILKYEADSILCANSPTSLNDWLEWSWAGAPKAPDDRFSGNGGLSLRKVSAIRRVLKFQKRYNDTEPEDEWFGRRLWTMRGEKVASGLTMLAVEGVYTDQPMGFHVQDGGRNLPDAVWKSKENRKNIFTYCPEVNMIMDMKLERERCEGDNKEGEIIVTPEMVSKSLASVASASKAAKASAMAASGSSGASEAKPTPHANGDKKPSGTKTAVAGSVQGADSAKQTGSSGEHKDGEKSGQSNSEKKEGESEEKEGGSEKMEGNSEKKEGNSEKNGDSEKKDGTSEKKDDDSEKKDGNSDKDGGSDKSNEDGKSEGQQNKDEKPEKGREGSRK